MRLRLIAGLTTTVLLGWFGAAAAAASGPVVVTPNGSLEGITVGASAQWRGIPYAAPPVGSLRWRAPAPAAPWTGVRDASAFAPPCAQPEFDDTGAVIGVLGREDCLYLNVFAPAAAAPGARLPVMVHLHGGSNSQGAPYTDAAAFNARGVIVVTVAYRLGAFGFVGHPTLSAEGGGTSGEYGVLDQIAALHWVHDNIAAFGGDPSNVALFGLSAGSFDTVAIAASPLAHGLLTRAAVQGDVLGEVTGAGAAIGDADVIGQDLFGSLGCATAACLRAASTEDVIRAARFNDIVPWVGGAVLPRSPLELIADRGIPLLIGFDREEDTVFEIPFVPDTFLNRHWVHFTNLLVGMDVGAAARGLYPEADYDSLRSAYMTMATDAKRGCPTRRLANAAVAHAPVFRFLYTHTYENDPELASFRASHALEEPFIWSNFDVFEFLADYEPTAAESALAGRMTSYWANFARTGDPNGPGLPQWPAYETTTEPVLALDDEHSVLHRYHAQQCALLDTVEQVFPTFPRGNALGLIKF